MRAVACVRRRSGDDGQDGQVATKATVNDTDAARCATVTALSLSLRHARPAGRSRPVQIQEQTVGVRE